MLKRHSEFFKQLLFLGDLCLIGVSWLAAYGIRFYSGIFSIPYGIPPLMPYLWQLIPIIVIWGIVFHSFNLYRPRRIGTHISEILDIAKANTAAVLVLVTATFFLKQFEYSRLVLVIFWGMNLVVLSLSRMAFREMLRFARRRGYNQRYALIVGTGKLGWRVRELLRNHPELGITVKGFLSEEQGPHDESLDGIPILGTVEHLPNAVQYGVDLVFMCLPPHAVDQSEKLLTYLGTTSVEVKFIPSVYEYIRVRSSAEMFDGLPIITIQGSPLYGWNVVLKRSTDIAGAMAGLLIASPFLFLIPILIFVTSGRPILYRQIRVGLDGKPFEMLKFRTMSVDAEAKSGPVWAKPNDPRRTRLGAFLRKTSLDELPQLWNVLKGEMSLVGPRPERPEFLEEFRQRFPHYMLRHAMKAGITGWAQVSGLRGDTSLEKRLEYDLYYIEHWSLWMDMKIIFLTFIKGFIHKHAY